MPRFFLRIVPILLAGMALLWADASAGATTAERLSLEALTAHATVIVTGQVGDATTAWDQPRRGIWTSVPLAVDSVIKHATGDGVAVGASLTISVRGGQVGDIEQAVPGAPRFTPGERVMVFLWRDRAERLRVVGLVQGAFREVITDEGTRYRNSYAGLCLVNVEAGTAADPDAYRPQEVTIAEVQALLPATEEATR